jgi:uncharacterized protein (TIGR00369 family)
MPDLDAARAAFARAEAGTQERFGDFFLARLYGLEISYPDDGCEVSFEARDFMFNPQGTLHGGVIATALDIAMGHLLHHAVGTGITLEFKVQFLGALRAGRVRCRGSFLQRGRSICFLRADAFDAAEGLCATATATWKLLRPPV